MPWGNNNEGKGPWGSSEPPANDPADFDEIIKKGRQQFDGFFGGGKNKKTILLAAVVAITLWLASGIYEIDTGEQGVVLRFGAFHRVSAPGLNYRIPSPIEKVIKVPVEKTEYVEIGVRSSKFSRRRGSGRSIKVLEESLMLTGDKNIAEVPFIVQWKINDASDFLFNVRDPSLTIKSVAESSMREVVGRRPIADALAEGKFEIEQETKEIMQSMLDNYKAGVEILRLQMGDVQPPDPVIDAFRDVETAKQDKETSINQANAYKNDIIPKARGESEKVIQEAKAYKEKTIALAKGQADRFISVYNKYKDAKEVTKKRIYLETMEEVLKGTEKILLDNEKGAGVVPYLPLPELNKKTIN